MGGNELPTSITDTNTYQKGRSSTFSNSTRELAIEEEEVEGERHQEREQEKKKKKKEEEK